MFLFSIYQKFMVREILKKVLTFHSWVNLMSSNLPRDYFPRKFLVILPENLQLQHFLNMQHNLTCSHMQKVQHQSSSCNIRLIWHGIFAPTKYILVVYNSACHQRSLTFDYPYNKTPELFIESSSLL